MNTIWKVLLVISSGLAIAGGGYGLTFLMNQTKEKEINNSSFSSEKNTLNPTNPESSNSTSTSSQVTPKVSKPEESINSSKLFFKPNSRNNRLTPKFQQPSHSLPKFQIL